RGVPSRIRAGGRRLPAPHTDGASKPTFPLRRDEENCIGGTAFVAGGSCSNPANPLPRSPRSARPAGLAMAATWLRACSMHVQLGDYFRQDAGTTRAVRKIGTTTLIRRV